MIAILDRPVLVVTAIVVLFLLTHVLQQFALRTARRQEVFQFDSSATSGPGVILHLGRVLLAVYVVGMGSILGGLWFRGFAGGYLLTLVVSVALNLEAIFRNRLLASSSTTAGAVRVSQRHVYLTMATQLFGSGLLMAGLFGVNGLPEFAGAGLILLSTSYGYWSKAQRMPAEPESATDPLTREDSSLR
jgi:hypothetical protein